MTDNNLSQELSKTVKSIENSIDELKNIINIIPQTEINIINYTIEKEKFEKSISSMKTTEITKYIESLGNVMLSKLYFDNMTEELNEYKNSLKIKVDFEVKNIQEKLQLQLQNQLNIQKIQHEKDIAILNTEMNFNEKKLNYICLLNNIEIPNLSASS
jgi:alkyl sulfatase BDS1-like metallo-beta-lactamase superfamily hydrolase